MNSDAPNFKRIDPSDKDFDIMSFRAQIAHIAEISKSQGFACVIMVGHLSLAFEDRNVSREGVIHGIEKGASPVFLATSLAERERAITYLTDRFPLAGVQPYDLVQELDPQSKRYYDVTPKFGDLERLNADLDKPVVSRLPGRSA
jgi:hypothetical protein